LLVSHHFPWLAQVYAQRKLSDKINLTGCVIKKVFINYALKKKQISLFSYQYGEKEKFIISAGEKFA